MNWCARMVCLLAATLAAQATTLEYLSMGDMIEKSTAIVRGRVLSSSASLHGPLIYTHYTVQVLECWKGPDASPLDIVAPGGEAQGMRQAFSGTPKLAVGGEYVLFLWTGTSGLTQVIGLSQGVFSLESDGKGGLIAARTVSTDTMLDPKTGRVISDQPVRLRLDELRSCVRALAPGGGTAK